VTRPCYNPRNVPEIRHSVCALDCPDACAVLVTIDGAGTATRLRGDPAHPVTRGFLCGKVARYLEREYSPNRLLYPMRRAGAKGEGRFVRVAWDEALDEIAVRLKAIATEFGPEAILPYSYAGTMGLLNGSGMDRRFFHRLGASRLDRTICSSAGGAGLIDALGFRYGTEPEQFRHSKLIIAWGANVLGTNVHLWPFIVEARRNGARFYTIDPRRNRTGAAADKHFFINPGSDTALALGMMHVIVGERLYDADYIARHTTGFADLPQRVKEYPPERAAALTGIAKEEIVALAREYATTRPAAIRLNYGVQRSERGAMAVRTIALLPALTGSWKDVGGGLQLSTSQAFHLNRAGLERADLQWRALGREARILNMSLLGEALNEVTGPPVKALVVYNSNPGAIAPNQNAVRRGLQRGDLFTVVLEQFQNDTADLRRLPAARHHVPGTHRPILRLRPLLPAIGAARARAAGRDKIERGGFSRARGADGLRRCLLRRFGRRHDPHPARVRSSLRARHRFGGSGTRALRAAAGSPRRRSIPAIRQWRLRHAFRQVRIPRGVHRDTRRPWNPALAMRACARASRWN
jgi:anaerobic selenocysteine-containing dehydrogenase